jgi:SAM-dependent methyltransferase
MFNERLKTSSGGRILDVGTGSGQFSKVLVEEFMDFTEITGIDASDRAIEAALKRFTDKRIKFIKMDAANMTFDNNSFDTVCISNTLHHLTEEEMYKTLSEMKRVLKPGGLFIVCEMYKDNQTPKQMGHVYIHHFGADLDRISGITHNETFDRQEIIDIVNNAGISITDKIDYIDDGESDKEEIDEVIKYFDKRLEELKTNPQYDSLKTKWECVKNHLINIGLSSATELVILGR